MQVAFTGRNSQGGQKRVILQLGNDIPAVQQVARERVPRQLRRADARGIVGKRRGHVVHRLGCQLIKSIIPVIRRRRNMILRPPLGGGEQVAAGVVGVGCLDHATRHITLF